MKRTLKIFFFAMLFTVVLNAGDYKIISQGGFSNTKILEDSSSAGFAVLATPNENNQFLVIDLNLPQRVESILVDFAQESKVKSEEISVYSSMSIVPWTKVEAKITQDNGKYLISLQNNFGRYFKIIFGNRAGADPIKISKIDFLAGKEIDLQKIANISVNKVTPTSVEISYETKQPSATQIVYGNNYDYIYGNTLDGSYSEPNLKLDHRVKLVNLQSNITYAYSVLAKDAGGKEIRSQIFYFSTVIKKDGGK